MGNFSGPGLKMALTHFMARTQSHICIKFKASGKSHNSFVPRKKAKNGFAAQLANLKHESPCTSGNYGHWFHSKVSLKDLSKKASSTDRRFRNARLSVDEGEMERAEEGFLVIR